MKPSSGYSSKCFFDIQLAMSLKHEIVLDWKLVYILLSKELEFDRAGNA